MSSTVRITVRIDEDDLKKLENIVREDGKYTLSDVVRDALREYIQRRESLGSGRRVELDIPEKVKGQLNKMVNDGEALNLEEMIRFILREYLKNKIEGSDIKKDSEKGEN
ncbi:ribbon-helix-helix domain-containing protein [Caldiplasma sukawensis]